jgi:Family of unknown function (DUF6232)
VAIRYLGQHARITDEVIESYCPHYQRFVISELEFIHIVRPAVAVTLAASQPVRVCSAGMTGLSAAMSVLGPVVHNVPVAAGSGCALVVAAAAMVATVRARRRSTEIRAVHRGQLVCVFATTNRFTLGQVARAILRVLEANADAR